MGAFWVNAKHTELLGPGTHGTTYGGTPLGCAVALKVLEVIERDGLARNARETGEFLQAELTRLMKRYPQLILNVRGVGFMVGFELTRDIRAFAGSERAASLQMVGRLQDAGMLVIPSGTHRIRLLPALNLSRNEAGTGIEILESVLAKLA